jgi:site-specific DNA-methyltransferase (adenine-specific)
MEHLAGELRYGWTFAIRHMGGDQRMRNLKIRNGWKPIFGFYRPPLKVWWDWTPDIIGAGKEKDTHPWQQAAQEAQHFIEHLSPKGGLVVDCFAGGGTTAVAAIRTERQYVCFEIEAEHVDDARMRLAAEKKRTNDSKTA